MSQWLQQHFDYLSGIDREFCRVNLRCWGTTRLRFRLLHQLELCRAAVPGTCLMLHAKAAALTRRLFSGIEEQEFPQTPLANAIAGSLDDEITHAIYREGSIRLRRFLRDHRLARVQLYGGIKHRGALMRQLRKHFTVGTRVDLWDAVRFRLVVSTLDEALQASTLIYSDFADFLVRCRNYYVRPRLGTADPYRAIHFELHIGNLGFIELQVMTALREAVGLIDHRIVHKKTIPFVSRLHELWLTDLSLMANVVDCRSRSKAQNAIYKILDRRGRPNPCGDL